MRISALNRGGLAVHDGHYDPHRNEAVAQIRVGETLSLSIEYESAPSALSTSGSGVTATAPSASGNVASLVLSAMQDGGHIDVKAIVGGAVRIVRIRARSQTDVDRYCFSDQLIGP